jgi:alcohol dehydrogenase, propanol-preferring
MKALVLKEFCEIDTGQTARVGSYPLKTAPLDMVDLPIPEPGPNQILVKVSTCGICHTELDEIEGRLAPSRLPVVLGHEIVGTVEGLGSRAGRHRTGDRWTTPSTSGTKRKSRAWPT